MAIRVVGGLASVRAPSRAGRLEIETQRLVHEDSLVTVVRSTGRAPAVREALAVVEAIQPADACGDLVLSGRTAGARSVAVGEHVGEERRAGAVRAPSADDAVQRRGGELTRQLQDRRTLYRH